MRKKVTIYLKDEVAASLEKAANAEQMAFSSYCSGIICEAAEKLPEDISPTDVEDEDDFGYINETVHVSLKGETAALLKKKAADLHLTPTEWVRNVVHRKNLTIYYVRLDDLEELLEVFGQQVRAVEDIVAACKETGKVTKTDIELIAERQKILNNLCLMQLSQTFNKREKEQEKLIKKNMERMGSVCEEKKPYI